MAAAHHILDLPNDLVARDARSGNDRDRQEPCQDAANDRRPEKLLVRRQGNDRELVGIAERARPLAQGADDGEFRRADPDALADRIEIWKQRRGRRIAEHDDGPTMRDLEVAEEPAVLQNDIVRFGEVRAGAHDHHLLGGLIAIGDALGLRSRATTKLQPHHGHRGGPFYDRFGVLLGQVGALHQLEKTASAGKAAHAELLQVDRVGAHLPDQLVHLIPETADQGGHRDDRRHADHHAENRQRGAQLVGAQRIERHGQDLGEETRPKRAAAPGRCVGGLGAHSRLNASIGSRLAARIAG